MIRIRNTSVYRFVGWWRINTDHPVPAASGITHGVRWVRAGITGSDTRAVDLFVMLDAGQTLTLPDLAVHDAYTWSPPAVPDNFFGGQPQLGGVNMTAVTSPTIDGSSTVQQWRRTIGPVHTDVWLRWYPNEPWVHAEALISHASPASAAFQASWSDLALTFGNGFSVVLGRPGYIGSLAMAGEVFADGAGRGLPMMFGFAGRIRTRCLEGVPYDTCPLTTAESIAQRDVASLQCLGSWGITGHGIQTLWPGAGNPVTGTTATTWAAANLAGATTRLHTWDVSPNGVTKNSGGTGNQADHVFVRGEAIDNIDATLVTYIEGFRWIACPNHFREADGSFLNRAARTRLRIYDGRPHAPTTQDEPGQPGSGMLGKPGDLNPSIHSYQWTGRDKQHWLVNGLYAAARLTTSPVHQWQLEHHAQLYLLTSFPNSSFGSNSVIQSGRELIWEGVLVTHLWHALHNRALAAEVRTRYETRWTNLIQPYIAPTWWDIRTGVSASVPYPPGPIPWQQAPATWAIDLANRTFGITFDTNLMRSARTLLDLSYHFVSGAWRFYEQYSLAPTLPPGHPTGLRHTSDSTSWTYSWSPPLLEFVLRYEPNNAKARAIRDQVFAMSSSDGGATRNWIPARISAL